MSVPISCDIFCKVIDNYGDIGVAWRLARQLKNDYAINVRLWVDELAALRYLCAAVSIDEVAQYVVDIDIRLWPQNFPAVEPAAWVIEMFACELPERYVQAMATQPQPPVWINLEYLSAEDWVAECHGLSSPQAHTALQKYFFFPGFSARTGGLLCERELPVQRHSFQESATARNDFLARFGISDVAGTRIISLFAYENSALPALLTAWANSAQPIFCLVPAGRMVAGIAQFFGEPQLPVGAIRRRGALSVAILPFLSQDDYDRLLWSCDLNFVRGEDSFVRAQWAARPLVWHIYPQQADAHWLKLNAFLDLYRAALPASAAAGLANFWSAWNGAGDIAAAWNDFEKALPAVTEHAKSWPEQLAERGNLAAALVQFCANHV